MIVVVGPPGERQDEVLSCDGVGVDSFNIDDRCAQILGSYRATPRRPVFRRYKMRAHRGRPRRSAEVLRRGDNAAADPPECLSRWLPALRALPPNYSSH